MYSFPHCNFTTFTGPCLSSYKGSYADSFGSSCDSGGCYCTC
uniref:Uncharacterized protein n=1 Tax=Arundo donax TaxID=35708 RepID=A0A0A9FF42_ARUDO